MWEGEGGGEAFLVLWESNSGPRIYFNSGVNLWWGVLCAWYTGQADPDLSLSRSAPFSQIQGGEVGARRQKKKMEVRHAIDNVSHAWVSLTSKV